MTFMQKLNALIKLGLALALFAGIAHAQSANNGYPYSSLSGAPTVNAAAQYDVPYYSAAGTVQTLSGAAISGFQFDSTSSAPAAATAAQLGTLANITGTQLLYSAGTTSALAGSANLTWSSPTLTIGVAGTTTGILKLSSSTATGSVSLTPAAATSAFIMTVPAATDTLAVLGTAQTFTAGPTFSTTAPVFAIAPIFNVGLVSNGAGNGSIGGTASNWFGGFVLGGASYYVNINAATPTGSHTLQIPALGGPDTFATLGVNQTFSGTNTFSAITTVNNILISKNTTVMAANGTTTSTSFAALTTTSLVMQAVPASTTRQGECDIIWETSATADTPTFALNTSATLTGLWIAGSQTYGSTSTVTNFLPVAVVTTATSTAFTAALTAAGATTFYQTHVAFTVSTNTNAQTITLYAKINAGTLTVQAGSSCAWLP